MTTSVKYTIWNSWICQQVKEERASKPRVSFAGKSQAFVERDKSEQNESDGCCSVTYCRLSPEKESTSLLQGVEVELKGKTEAEPAYFFTFSL